MLDQTVKTHPCDLCGSDDCAEISVLSEYSKDRQPTHVCKDCGFVYVRDRRSADAIAGDWTNLCYGQTYTARIPAVKARQIYVLETIDTWVGMRGKTICDIGGGEGQMMEIAKGPDYGAEVFAIEPSPDNCEQMRAKGIEAIVGTIEDYCASEDFSKRKFDIVTITWTLENCRSCVTMLKAAFDVLKPGGHVVVATGSRILVPFRKPLHLYVGDKVNMDTHCFRFSRNSLARAMMIAGFEVAHENRYLDTEYLVMAGRKTEGFEPMDKDMPVDNWQDVIDFFERWHTETVNHYPRPA